MVFFKRQNRDNAARRDRARRDRNAISTRQKLRSLITRSGQFETLEQRQMLAADPQLLLDINPTGNSNAEQFVQVGTSTFFVANDGTNGRELWKSDGTEEGTTLVKDIQDGANGSYPRNLTNVGGTLFFSANDETNGYELWKSDGTEVGTTLVKDIRTGIFGSNPRSLAEVGGALFFSADDGINGREVFTLGLQVVNLNILETNGGVGPFRAVLDPNDNTMIQIVDSTGAVQQTIDKTTINVLNVNGTDDDDVFTVDFTNGSPAPEGGITFSGGMQATPFGDVLNVVGSFNTQTITMTPPGPDGNNGVMDLDGGIINFFGLEPINAGNSVDTILNLTAGLANNATLRNNAAVGSIEIVDNGATFEDTIIPNPTGSLIINLGTMGDILNVELLDADFAVPLTINGGAMADTINAATTTTPLTIVAGAGNDIITGGLAADTINGGSGNDTITGGPGADIQFGDAGEDTFIWNNGDGPDDNTGGADTDTFTFNGADGADDTLFVRPGTGDGSLVGAEFHLERTLPSAFFVENFGVENVTVNSLAGDDTITIVASNVYSATVNGNQPVLPTLPGDVLNYQGTGTVTLTGAGSGIITSPGLMPVNYLSIESVRAVPGPLDLVISANADPGGDNVADDGAADGFRLVRNGANLEVYINGDLASTETYADVATITVNGSGDDDTLTVDHSGGLINRVINFDGNAITNAADNDTLVHVGDPGAAVIRETYLVGATEDAGTWILDPNDSMGAGALGATDGDESIVNFTNLEPADSSVPAVIFDVVFFAGNVDNITVQDGGLLAGFNSIQVTDNNATFETFRFANKTTARLHLNDGADTATLNYTTTADGLTSLEIFGHGAVGVAGLVAEDNAADQFALIATADNAAVGPAFDTSLFGDGGNDRFNNFTGVVPNGTSSLATINGRIQLDGGAGGDDEIGLNAFNDAAITATLTAIQLTGAAPGTIDYANVEEFTLGGSDAGNDVIDIASTAAGTSYLILANGGDDTVTIGNSTADFNANVLDGTLAAIAGRVIVAPGVGNDTLNVDASGDGALAGVADISNIGNDAFAYGGFNNTGNTTSLSNFAAANIDYRHDATAGGHGTDANNRLEQLNVRASTGDDVINVNATTAVTATTIDSLTGNDTVTINGDNLSADNVFLGNAGNDEFVLNVAADLGMGALPFAALTSLSIQGQGPAADSDNRDRLTINDNSGAARGFDYDFQDAGGVNVEDGFAIDVQVRTMETVIFNDPADNDNVSITGTSNDDDLTVALKEDATSVLAFLGGTPYLEAPPAPLAGAPLPGVAGGGNGPDLLINGLTDGSAVNLFGDGNTATVGLGDRGIVYAADESNLSTGGALDIFGFGAGVLIPGFDPGDAYDQINVDGTTGTVMVNNIDAGPLNSVVIDNASFTQAGLAMSSQRAALIVNGGDEAVPNALNGIADSFDVTASILYNIQINGNNPDPGGTDVNGFPTGDQLNLTSPDSINVFSDKATPPNVSTTFGNNIFGIRDSSIERKLLTPGNGVVNLIGDNNDPSPAADQNDNFVIVGRDVDGDGDGINEATLLINGLTSPILIDGMTDLNVYGFELAGQPLLNLNAPNPNFVDPSAIGFDTLDISPYADDTPRGWGVDVFFNEGEPSADDIQDDLIIYRTSMFGGQVSEGIVIQPSDEQDGEIVVTNLGFGTPIVDIDYVGNMDIIVIDDDGFQNDTDRLTLRGTNPDNLGTSGNDVFNADFTAAGAVGTPLVSVSDAAGGILYQLRNTQDVGGNETFDTIFFETLGGNDTINLTGRADGSLSAHVLGGAGSDTLNITTATGLTYVAGNDGDSGTFVDDNGAVFSFDEVENFGVTFAPAVGTVTVNGTGDDDEITVTGVAVGVVDVTVNAGPTIRYNNVNALTVNGHGGDDDITLDLDIANLGVTINVDGGLPTTDRDRVRVTGVAGQDDTPNFTPSASDAGILQLAGQQPINIINSEELVYDGEGDNETLTVTGTAGVDIFNHTPGVVGDAGLVRIDSTLGIAYEDLGATGSVTFAGTAGNDTLVAYGTNSNDTLTVAAVTGAVTLVTTSATHVVLNQTNVENLTVDGLDGDDTFNVPGNHPYTTLSVHGGNPDNGSDVLNFAGAGAAITANLAARTVTETGFLPVDFVGIETVNITAAGAALNADLTANDDELTYRPTGAQAGTFRNENDNTTFNFTNVAGAFTVNALASVADHLIIEGTNSQDRIAIDSPNRTATVTDAAGTVLKTVTMANDVEIITAMGRAGNDTFTVTPAPTVGGVVNGNLLINVDGGGPGASDALVIATAAGTTLPATDFAVNAVGLNPGEGRVRVFRGAVAMPDIAYTNIEIVSPNVVVAGGVPQLLVIGPDTSEPNEFRTNATHLGAGETVNLDNAAIFSNNDHPGVPADTDFYQIVAESTGTIDVTAYFEMYAVGLLPGGGDLTLSVLDAAGNTIIGFGTNDNDPDARVRFPAVQGQTYFVRVTGSAANVVNGYELTITNEAPPTPFDLELDDAVIDGAAPEGSDTGRSQFDNVTLDTTPTIFFRLDDSVLLNDIANPTDDAAITIPFQTTATTGYRVAVFDEGATPGTGAGTVAPQTPLGFATQVAGVPGLYTFTTPALADGSHFLSARVQILDPSTPQVAALTARSESFEIIVDSVAPPVSFGEVGIVDDGLHPDSDTGNPNIVGTLSDNITSDLTPTFFGRAEANSIVRMFLDSNSNGNVDAGDLFLGQDVAVPLDGTNQHPGGAWTITSTVGMNDPAVLAALGLPATTLDGVRPILIQAEDVAGNVSPDSVATRLTLFVDTQGPQVTDVRITGRPAFDLFTLKPNNVDQGPTPRVDSITISVRDLPARIVPSLFQYAALSNVEDANSAISVIGDHSGIVPITSIVFTGDANVNNINATGQVVLTFAEPLADDRFTLTVEDGLTDPVGNALDGESQGSRPIGTIGGISGDNAPGGDFIARFTVDSRPEVGSISQGLIYVDINGNQVFDPEGQDNDAVNRDFVYQFGRISDGLFAGNFGPAGTAGSGFDKLAAYGALNSSSANPQYSFLIDTNDDGVGDVTTLSPFQVNAIPVAGNFFNSAADIAAVAAGGRASDEVALFDGQNWYVDTTGDFIPDTQIAANYIGIPMIGDFNGDGVDDFAVYENDTNVIIFDTNRDGVEDSRFQFGRFPGLSGFTDKPVVGDLNLDGVDDFGIWVKARDGVLPREAGEYFFWLSDNPLGAPAANAADNFNPFSPDTLPGGNDLFTQWGDEFALPILGNFDPVLSDTDPVDVPSSTNRLLAADVNNDGFVTALDALIVINALNDGNEGIDLSNRLRAEAVLGSGFYDVDGNETLTALDALRVVNTLNELDALAGGSSEPLADSSVEPTWQESVDVFFEDDDDDEDQDVLDEAIALMF